MAENVRRSSRSRLQKGARNVCLDPRHRSAIALISSSWLNGCVGGGAVCAAPSPLSMVASLRYWPPVHHHGKSSVALFDLRQSAVRSPREGVVSLFSTRSISSMKSRSSAVSSPGSFHVHVETFVTTCTHVTHQIQNHIVTHFRVKTPLPKMLSTTN